MQSLNNFLSKFVTVLTVLAFIQSTLNCVLPIWV